MTTLSLIDCTDSADLDTVIHRELAVNFLPADWAQFIRKLPFSDNMLEFLMYVIFEFGFVSGSEISMAGFERCVLLGYSPEEAEALAGDHLRLHALREGMIAVAEELALIYRCNGRWLSTPFAQELWDLPHEEVRGRVATLLYALYVENDLLDQVEDNTGETLS
ncbi:hypothetical protein CKALI_03365 [Corynebacterium kalinowskii]|uniref:Uncharacterized protein n=1 Tax=Corynebacterium kalinowskii TaxID=2675216 RepID=A0A6B8VS27_9CORY|nr:hypothetical protein [Corynebacterium kalinowskii]QGU01556.1 hypothetical protein CKALI_03365 [Corynebacterium kalinowskii]